MIETVNKESKTVDWFKANSLTQEQVKKLIAAKFARAAQYREAVRKREVLCGGR